MTDDFPPTNDIAPTGNSYGHYDEHYAPRLLFTRLRKATARETLANTEPQG